MLRRNSVTPLTSPESNIKKPRIDELDEPPIQELPPTVASLALCSPSHPSLALSGQVDVPAHLSSSHLLKDTESFSPASAPTGFYINFHACLLICFPSSFFSHVLSPPLCQLLHLLCTFQHWLGKVCL